MNESMMTYTAVIIALNIFLVVYMFWLGFKKPTHPIRDPVEPKGEAMRPYLYLKMFYVNPRDPRGFVPKIQPKMGWTINFRDNTQANIFIAILIAIVVTSFFMVKEVL